jgi:hypothetical protein
MPPIESGAAYATCAVRPVCLVRYRVPIPCLIPTIVESILEKNSRETCLSGEYRLRRPQ